MNAVKQKIKEKVKNIISITFLILKLSAIIEKQIINPNNNI